MESLRLKLSAPLMAAIACLLAYYGGYTAFLLFAGYVFLRESDQWLKRFCVKTLLLMFAFSVASTVINLIPDLLDVLYGFLSIFNVSLYLRFFDNVRSFFSSILSITKMLAFLGFAIAGLKQKAIKISFVDTFLDKHMSADKAEA